MFGDGYDVLRARLLEDARPFGGVEVLSTEERDEVLVTFGWITAVAGPEVFVGTLAGAVHVARVPLVFSGRHRVDAPVDEDAKLGVFVPLRLLVLDQGRP